MRNQVRDEIARRRPMAVRIDLGGVELLDSSGGKVDDTDQDAHRM